MKAEAIWKMFYKEVQDRARECIFRVSGCAKFNDGTVQFNLLSSC